MKNTKILFLGVLMLSIVVPNLFENLKIQKVIGEVKSENVAPLIVENKKITDADIAPVIADEQDDYAIIDNSIIENTEAKVREEEPQEEIYTVQIPQSHYAYQLLIPKIGVDAPVLALGLEPGGKMDVPDNYSEVGWYSLGTVPGRVGNAVMGAHVDNGAAISGVFKNLKNLEAGDSIYVAGENGEQLHFKVAVRKIYDYRLSKTKEIFGSWGKSQIVLITCHGEFLPTEGTYDQRLVIFAELVS